MRFELTVTVNVDDEWIEGEVGDAIREEINHATRQRIRGMKSFEKLLNGAINNVLAEMNKGGNNA